ncbi:MAG: hypothetical protein CML51_03180 [Rhodobacteraceae bacterium]|nr:hypothetical protein [Paracoccaceae bacterium]
MGDEARFIALKNASPPLKPTRQAFAPVWSNSCLSWLKNGPCGPYNSRKLRSNPSDIFKYPAACRVKWDGFFEKTSVGCS